MVLGSWSKPAGLQCVKIYNKASASGCVVESERTCVVQHERTRSFTCCLTAVAILLLNGLFCIYIQNLAKKGYFLPSFHLPFILSTHTEALSRVQDIHTLQLQPFANKISVEWGNSWEGKSLFPSPKLSVIVVMIFWKVTLLKRDMKKNVELQWWPGGNTANLTSHSCSHHRESNGFIFLHHGVTEAQQPCWRHH